MRAPREFFEVVAVVVFAVVVAVVADVVGDTGTADFVVVVAVDAGAADSVAVVGPEGEGVLGVNMADWGEFLVGFRSKQIPSLSMGTFVMAEFVYVLDRTETVALCAAADSVDCSVGEDADRS